MPNQPITPRDETQQDIEALSRLLNQRTVAPSPQIAAFFEETNRLKQELTHNQPHPLLEDLVRSIRKHCEPLLPLATGKYKSHGNVCLVPIIIPGSGHLAFEIGHEGGHVAGHGVHYLLHELHQLDILHIAGTLLNAIPFIAGAACCAVKIFEIWKEHRLINAIQKQHQPYAAELAKIQSDLAEIAADQASQDILLKEIRSSQEVQAKCLREIAQDQKRRQPDIDRMAAFCRLIELRFFRAAYIPRGLSTQFFQPEVVDEISPTPEKPLLITWH